MNHLLDHRIQLIWEYWN